MVEYETGAFRWPLGVGGRMRWTAVREGDWEYGVYEYGNQLTRGVAADSASSCGVEVGPRGV